MSTPPTATLVITCDEALLIAAHLKIHARRMQDAADRGLPGIPHLPSKFAQMMKEHSAAFDAFADKLYAPFIERALTAMIDEAAEQVATDLRSL